MNVLGIFILLIAIITGFLWTLSKGLRKRGIVLLLCAIAFCAWQWQKEKRWERQFPVVPQGASIEQVIAALGRPSIIADSSKSPLGYSLTQHNKNVRKELWYVSFYFPEQFDFGFDEHGLLIDRYHYVSP
jgi:hypothetical protein